jgi:transcription-repair coupling factor (superfamily II helicase)
MSAFERKYEVLLSTTIVESGIDIPSANTRSSSTAPTALVGAIVPVARPRGSLKLRAYAYLTTRRARP